MNALPIELYTRAPHLAWPNLTRYFKLYKGKEKHLKAYQQTHTCTCTCMNIVHVYMYIRIM